MLPDVSTILPGLVTLVLFGFVVRAVLHALLRPTAKIVLIMGALVLLGVITPSTVSGLLVGAIGFLFETVQVAYASVVP